MSWSHIILALFFSLKIIHSIFGQTGIKNHGTKIIVESDAIIYIPGDYENTNILPGSDSPLYLEGTLKISGNLLSGNTSLVNTDNNGLIQLKGSRDQQIVGSDSFIPNLSVNKSGGTVVVDNLKIGEILDAKTHPMEISGSNLRLINASARIINEKNESRIFGSGGVIISPMDFVMPSGFSESNVFGLGIGFVLNPDQSFNKVNLARNTGQLKNVGVKSSIKRYFNFSSSGTGSFKSINFSYFKFELNNDYPEELLTVFKSENNGLTWEKIGTNTNVNSNRILAEDVEISGTDILFALAYDCIQTPEDTPEITSSENIDNGIIHLCEDETVELSYEGNSTAYFWEKEGSGIIEYDQPINVSEKGNYTLTIRKPNGCEFSNHVFIEIHSIPEADFIINPSPSEKIFCKGAELTLTDNSSNSDGSPITRIQWVIEDGTQLGKKVTHNFKNTGNQTIDLQVETLYCKSIIESKSLVILPDPVASFALPSDEFCSQERIKLENFSEFKYQNISRAFESVWTYNGNQYSGSNQFSPDLEASENNLTLEILPQDPAEGCYAIIEKQIQVYPNPITSFKILDGGIEKSSVCKSDYLDLINESAISDNSELSYNWELPFLSSSEENLSLQFLEDGNQEIKLTSTSINGCVDSASKVIDVYPVPGGNFSVNKRNVCEGEGFVIKNESEPFSELTYNWSFGDGSFSNASATNFTHRYDTPGIYEIKLERINQYGCANTVNRTVNIHAKPLIDFSVGNICERQSIQFINKSLVENSEIAEVSWEFGDDTGSEEFNPVHSFENPGSYDLSLSILSDEGCSDTLIREILVHRLPTFSLGEFVLACSDSVLIDPGTDNNSFLDNTSFKWYDSGDNLISDDVSIYIEGSGAYYAELSNQFCENRVEVPVFLSKSPDLGDNGEACEARILADRFAEETGALNIIYNWYRNNEIIETGDDQIQVVQSGNYVVEKSVFVESEACMSYDTLNVQINNSPQINLYDEYEFCSGDTLKVEQNPEYTYEWKNLQSNKLLSTSNTISIHDKSSAIQVIVSNGECDTSKVFVVKKKSAPNTSFLLTENSLCEGDTINIINTSSTSIEDESLNYTWEVDGRKIPEKDQVAKALSEAGHHIVSLTAEDANSCSGKVEESVFTERKPNLAFHADATCQDSEIHFLNESKNLNEYEFHWSFGDGNVSTEIHPYYTFESPGKFVVGLSVTNSNCKTSVKNQLEIFPQPILDFSDSIKTCGDQLIFSLKEKNTSYEWYENGKLISQKGGYQFKESGNYKIIAVNENGCKKEKNITLELKEKPEIDFPDSIQVCDSVILKVPSLPKAEYLWSTGHTEPELIAQQSGLYTINITDQNECSTTDSIYVKLEETIYFDLGSDVLACEDDTISIGSDIPVNLQWSNGELSNYIELTETEKVFATAKRGHCMFTDSILVTFLKKPNAAFEVKNHCQNDVIQFSPIDSESFSNTFNWDFGDGTQSRGVSKEKSYSSGGIYEVSLEVISPNNCRSKKTRSIQIYSAPDAEFNLIGKCKNEGISFDILNENTSNFYTWEFGDGTISKDLKPSHLYTKVGKYDVTLLVKDTNNCTNNSTQSLNIHDTPQIDLQSQLEFCKEKIVLDAGNYTSFLWSDGSKNRYLSVNEKGYYSVLASNKYGCKTIDSAFVEPVHKPDLLPEDTTACGSMILEPTYEGFSYLWSNGSTDPYIEVFNSDQYRLQAISEELCIWKDSIDVIINEIPVIELGEDIAACKGDTVKVNAYHPLAAEYIWSSGQKDEQVIVTENDSLSVTLLTEKNCIYSDYVNVNFYSRPVFNFPDSIFECQIAEISTGLGSKVQHIWSNGSESDKITVESEGLYWVEAVNYFGCNYIDSVFLKVYPLPDIDLGNDLVLCNDERFTLEIPSEYDSISWSTGDTTQALNIETSGKYWVKIKDLYGCENSDTLSVEIEPPIQVGLKDFVYLCQKNEEITLESPFDFKNYRWYSSKGLETRRSRLKTLDPGKYWLIVENDMGCFASDTSIIKDTNQKLEASFLIPSVASVGDWVNFSILTEPLPDKILWNFGDGASSTDINPVYQYFREGDFEVTLRVENNTCIDVLNKTITIDEDFIDDFQSSAGFTVILDSKIYPNPNNGIFLLDIELSEKSLTKVGIFNLTGDKIYEKIVEIKDDQLQIDISDQLPNNYLLVVQTGRNVLVNRIVKSR